MIYLVEDDASIRELVVYALNNSGFEAHGFDTPSAFWSAMAKEVPTMVLLDIMLPEEDGMEVLRKLRADPRTAKLPVLMLTAKSTEYDKVQGLDAGADDYITKPFGIMELMARIRTALRHAGSARSISCRNDSVLRPCCGACCTPYGRSPTMTSTGVFFISLSARPVSPLKRRSVRVSPAV